MSARSIDTLVVAYDLLDAAQLERIRGAAPGARVVVAPSGDDWDRVKCEVAARVEVFLGFAPVRDLPLLPKLAWVQQPGAGADWLMHAPAFRDSAILLTNASGVHAIPIAEHVLALMFALSRRIHRFVRAQRDHEWRPRGRLGELDGATIGIVGLGSIGAKTAEKARGLNMRVLGLRRDPSRPCPHVERLFGPDQLHAMLPEVDWLVLAAALTPETTHLMGEREFAAMKERAYLINVGRGALVDEPALIRALRDGQIGGAGLDVFEREPLPADSPLWDMGNVVLTPHFAGATPHYAQRVTDIFVENLRRFQAGEPLVNQVDKRLAY